jgi:hypothetical protein
MPRFEITLSVYLDAEDEGAAERLVVDIIEGSALCAPPHEIGVYVDRVRQTWTDDAPVADLLLDASFV